MGLTKAMQVLYSRARFTLGLMNQGFDDFDSCDWCSTVADAIGEDEFIKLFLYLKNPTDKEIV